MWAEGKEPGSWRVTGSVFCTIQADIFVMKTKMEMMHFHFVKTVTRGIRKKKTKPYNNKMFGHKTTEPKTKMTVRTEVSFKPRSRTWHCLYLQNISICLGNMEFLSPTIVYAISSLTSAIKKLSINIPCKFTSLYTASIEFFTTWAVCHVYYRVFKYSITALSLQIAILQSTL